MYFHFHTNEGNFDEKLNCMSCQFIKADGLQCKNRVCIGLPYCWLHERFIKHLEVTVSNIPNAGLGVYAFNGTDTREIIFKQGDLVTPYFGQVIDKDKLWQKIQTIPCTIRCGVT